MHLSLSQQTQHLILENGLTVILKSIPGEILSVNLAIKTGSLNEGEHLGKGLSHYLEHLLFKGTTHRTGTAIDNDIENAHGQHNAYTSWDQTVYYITGINEGLPVYLDVLADMAFHSTLDEPFMASERDVILEEMTLYHDKPRSLLWQMLLWSEFNTSPLRYPVIGFASEFKKITREDLLNYYKKYYVPNNMVLLIAGDITVTETLKYVNQYFGHYPKQPNLPPIHTFEPSNGQSFCLRLKTPQNHAYGVLKYRVPYLNSDYDAVFEVLSGVLGASENSLLWKKLRKQLKIVHTISCSYDELGAQGSLSIHYACDPKNILKVETEIEKLIFSLTTKCIPTPLIERIKRQTETQMLLGLTTVQEQAAALLDNYLTHQQIAYSDIYYQKLKTVTANDIQTVAKLFFHDWNCIKATIEPGENAINLNTLPDNLPISLGPKADQATLSDFHAAFPNQIALPCENPTHTHPLFAPLSNNKNISIYYQQDPKLPITHLSVTLKAGVLYEENNRYGSTTLLAAILKRSHTAIIEAIENLGGHCDDHASDHSLSFTLTVLSQHFTEACALFVKIFNFPTESPIQKIFKQEKKAQIDAIKHAMNKIETHSFWNLRQIVLKGTPFENPAIGRLSTVKNITIADLQALWNKLYHTGNTFMGITGSFDTHTLLHSLTPLIDTIPINTLQPLATHQANPEIGRHQHTIKGKKQAFICQAYKIPGNKERREIPYIKGIMQKMMNSMSSSLFKSLREAGLVYSAGAVIISGWEDSIWTFYAGTHPKKKHLQKIHEAFESEIKHLKEGLIDTETLERAKKSLLVSLASRQQDFINRCGTATGHWILNDNVNEWTQYKEAIQSVSIQNIQAFAHEFFNPHQKIELNTLPTQQKPSH